MFFSIPEQAHPQIRFFKHGFIQFGYCLFFIFFQGGFFAAGLRPCYFVFIVLGDGGAFLLIVSKLFVIINPGLGFVVLQFLTLVGVLLF